MTTDEFRNKADEEILNLFVLATEGYAVDYFRMELDRAYRHKQVAYILREELRRRLYNTRITYIVSGSCQTGRHIT